jgi:hypothetical protein
MPLEWPDGSDPRDQPVGIASIFLSIIMTVLSVISLYNASRLRKLMVEIDKSVKTQARSRRALTQTASRRQLHSPPDSSAERSTSLSRIPGGDSAASTLRNSSSNPVSNQPQRAFTFTSGKPPPGWRSASKEGLGLTVSVIRWIICFSSPLLSYRFVAALSRRDHAVVVTADLMQNVMVLALLSTLLLLLYGTMVLASRVMMQGGSQTPRRVFIAGAVLLIVSHLIVKPWQIIINRRWPVVFIYGVFITCEAGWTYVLYQRYRAISKEIGQTDEAIAESRSSSQSSAKVKFHRFGRYVKMIGVLFIPVVAFQCYFFVRIFDLTDRRYFPRETDTVSITEAIGEWAYLLFSASFLATGVHYSWLGFGRVHEAQRILIGQSLASSEQRSSGHATSPSSTSITVPDELESGMAIALDERTSTNTTVDEI